MLPNEYEIQILNLFYCIDYFILQTRANKKNSTHNLRNFILKKRETIRPISRTTMKANEL